MNFSSIPSLESALNKVSSEIDVLIDQAKKLNKESESKFRDIVDLLGQPSGKFDYKVYYSPPPSASIPVSSIKPTGWNNSVSITIHITV